MSRVELVYDQTCPNVEAAREEIRSALAATGLSGEWVEWDREADDSPDQVRSYGSPTVLVDGVDVSGAGSEADANCCRVYVTEDGFGRAPSARKIQQALTTS